MFGQQMGDNLADLFEVWGGMLAGAREATKSEMFLLWFDGPNRIVDFSATIEIVTISYHYATQHAGNTICCRVWPLLQACASPISSLD